MFRLLLLMFMHTFYMCTNKDYLLTYLKYSTIEYRVSTCRRGQARSGICDRSHCRTCRNTIRRNPFLSDSRNESFAV